MARFGINPARGKTSSYSPAEITVATLTYLPHLDGYFRDRFEVLKLSIASILAHTTQPYDFLVFDNGSCEQVVSYLQGLKSSGAIDYLILSAENIGKIGAFQLLFNAAPGEYVAYADDDIYFYPGWLESLLDVVKSFPEVGMVSGAPVRDASSRASGSLQRLIEAPGPEVRVTWEHRIPDEWEADWAKSVGRDPDVHLQDTKDQLDVILERDGIEVFGSASHFQFLSPKKIILEALPKQWSGKLMGEMNELDEAVDQQGYLRLSTVARFTRHMGNTIGVDLVENARKIGFEQEIEPRKVRARKHWLLTIPGSGRFLRMLYNYLFNVLHNIE